MDEKLCFVADCLRGEVPIAALCEDYGISRKTAYKWLGRYREGGPAGLLERSRAPHRHGRSMAPDVAEAIVALRRDRPHWGPRKLRAALMRARPEVVWPAASASQQQARFDRFRHDFNHNRPHEALDQRPPAAFWQPSPRPCPERPAGPGGSQTNDEHCYPCNRSIVLPMLPVAHGAVQSWANMRRWSTRAPSEAG